MGASFTAFPDVTTTDLSGYLKLNGTTDTEFFVTNISPSPNGQGDLWYHTTDNELYLYDGTRWLSVSVYTYSWASTATHTGSGNLDFHSYAPMTNSLDLVVPWNARVMQMTIRNNEGTTPDTGHGIDLKINNSASAGSPYTFDGSNPWVHHDVGEDLSANDQWRPQIFHGGSGTDPVNISVVVNLRRRR